MLLTVSIYPVLLYPVNKILLVRILTIMNYKRLKPNRCLRFNLNIYKNVSLGWLKFHLNVSLLNIEQSTQIYEPKTEIMVWHQTLQSSVATARSFE